MLKAFAVFVFALCVASTASAHPGHGAAGDVDVAHALMHYLTEPIHLSSLLGTVVFAAGWALVRSYRGRDRDGGIAVARR